MKLDHLQTFCALIEGGSLDEAARRVHRTQPAVSQHLRALETELDRTLYERRAGRATAAGEKLYDRAKAILNAEADLRRELRAHDEALEELTVGASDTNALYFLPAYIRAFRNAHAQTPLSVVCRPSGAIAEAVANREIDVGIVTMPVDAASLAVHPLDQQRLVLITPRDHTLYGKSRVSAKRLRDEAFVLLESSTRTGAAIEAFLSDHAISPRVVMRTGSFEVVKRYVAEGVGIAFVPDRALNSVERQSFGVLTVPGLPKPGIGVVWRASGYQPLNVRRFLNVLGVETEAVDSDSV